MATFYRNGTGFGFRAPTLRLAAHVHPNYRSSQTGERWYAPGIYQNITHPADRRCVGWYLTISTPRFVIETHDCIS